MMRTSVLIGSLALASVVVVGCASAPAGPAGMSFSSPAWAPARAATWEGLKVLTSIARMLAQSGGAGSRTWRAYLSTQAPALNSPAFVNARDRIGTGPWQNAKGEVIARNVEELHSDASKLTKATAMDEMGRRPGTAAPRHPTSTTS